MTPPPSATTSSRRAPAASDRVTRSKAPTAALPKTIPTGNPRVHLVDVPSGSQPSPMASKPEQIPKRRGRPPTVKGKGPQSAAYRSLSRGDDLVPDVIEIPDSDEDTSALPFSSSQIDAAAAAVNPSSEVSRALIFLIPALLLMLLIIIASCQVHLVHHTSV